MVSLSRREDAVKEAGPAPAAFDARHLTARALTILRVLAIAPFLLLLVEAHAGDARSRVAVALLFTGVVVSDAVDGRLARAAGRATRLWGVIDVAADAAFNAAALGVAAVLGLMGAYTAAGVAVLAGLYLVRALPALAGADESSPSSYDPLGHAAGVAFYVLSGLAVGHVAVGIPGAMPLRIAADAVFAYTLLVLGVRLSSLGKRSA